MTEEFYFLLFVIALSVVLSCELIHSFLRNIPVNWERYPVNGLLLLFHMVVISFLPLGALAFSKLNASFLHWGLFQWLQVPFVIEFLCCLITISFTYYILHIAMHQVPFLWRFHKIHHSDDILDATTVFRRHPLTELVTFPFILVPVLSMGFPPETIVANYAIILVLEIFQHSKFMIPKIAHRYMSWFIVTPQMHHLHHTDQSEQTDSNFGNDFAFWDRIFGTYKEWYACSDINYGLDSMDTNNVHDLDYLLTMPLRR